jgi:hypothetical protein
MFSNYRLQVVLSESKAQHSTELRVHRGGREIEYINVYYSIISVWSLKRANKISSRTDRDLAEF